MPILLWDASALVKHYTPEIGSDTVDALFKAVPPAQMIVTFQGYAETYSILLRKRHRDDITAPTFAAAKSVLRTQVIDNPDFRLMVIDETSVLAGISLMERHHINSSDAAILAAYCDHARTPPISRVTYILVSADLRLLRAADAEGLKTLNPEIVSAAAVPAFLSAP